MVPDGPPSLTMNLAALTAAAKELHPRITNAQARSHLVTKEEIWAALFENADCM